jgi:hypothetical protein
MKIKTHHKKMKEMAAAYFPIKKNEKGSREAAASFLFLGIEWD